MRMPDSVFHFYNSPVARMNNTNYPKKSCCVKNFMQRFFFCVKAIATVDNLVYMQ